MSSRQNKKRKGRNNGLNRERTVTTLTEGPESSFLVPTSTEEPASNIMSSPTFSVASSAGGPQMSPANFQMTPGPFPAFSYNSYLPSMSSTAFAPQHPSQQFFHSASQGPLQPSSTQPGQNDLEVLEKLKETIKNGQHEYFRPVPQPAALASVYLGPKLYTQGSSHADQAPSDSQHPHGFDSQEFSSPASPTNEYGQRPRQQASQVREGPGKMNAESSVSDLPTVNNVLLVLEWSLGS